MFLSSSHLGILFSLAATGTTGNTTGTAATTGTTAGTTATAGTTGDTTGTTTGTRPARRSLTSLCLGWDTSLLTITRSACRAL